MTIAAGTRTGLNRKKSGVVTASPTTVVTRVRADIARRKPPTGKSITAATALEAGGLLSRHIL
ncbi:hypothetical protein IEQ34_001305 [Dendrobium chrysotoxum]|uniref:Uncharacterized protein n=1 Tax=Dendrobium chrysotoxum TaxID=161865 RepID=A0AAV7HMX6_DENCH|nr:hypothetical protein IEQ34_001305 [Dendrobium chrysotoxum]